MEMLLFSASETLTRFQSVRSAWKDATTKNGGACWELVRLLSGNPHGFDAATQAMIAKGELVEVRRDGPADPLNGMPFPMYRLAEVSL